MQYPPATWYGSVSPGPGFWPSPGMAMTVWIDDPLCGGSETTEVQGQVVYSINVFAEGTGIGLGVEWRKPQRRQVGRDLGRERSTGPERKQAHCLPGVVEPALPSRWTPDQGAYHPTQVTRSRLSPSPTDLIQIGFVKQRYVS